MKFETPRELMQYLETLPHCKKTTLIEYNEEPAMVFVVYLTFWAALYCLLFGGDSIKKRFKDVVENGVPKEIQHITLIVF